MPTMILSAGLGTRLAPLSTWRAKALVPVGDRPAIAHILERVLPLGDRIVANAHHRAGDLEGYLGEHAADVRVSHEERLLGTAGGVAHAAAELGEGDVLVHNGDILASFDLAALVAHHRTDATLAIEPGPPGTGNVGVDAEGRITRLRKESVRGGEVQGGYFSGIQILGAGLREGLPQQGCLVGDVYLPALRRGATLEAFVIDGFSDIGSVASYVEANRAWLRQRGLAAWRAPDARVGAGVRMSASLVGSGAEVAGEGLCDGCIVWPGARVDVPLRNAIVAPEGVHAF